MIHNQVDSVTALARVHRALVPAGVFVTMDVKASSHLADNIDNPFTPWLYGISTQTLQDRDAGTRRRRARHRVGRQLARKMLADAGSIDVEVRDVPDEPLDSVHVACKRAS